MGHLIYRHLKNSLTLDSKAADEKCETWCSAKSTKTPVPKKHGTKASTAREGGFADVVGQITPSSVNGFRYVVTISDEYSSHAGVNFMRLKNQALQKFKEYLAENGSRSILRSDNCTEYTIKSFKTFVKTTK